MLRAQETPHPHFGQLFSNPAVDELQRDLRLQRLESGGRLIEPVLRGLRGAHPKLPGGLTHELLAALLELEAEFLEEVYGLEHVRLAVGVALSSRVHLRIGKLGVLGYG